MNPVYKKRVQEPYNEAWNILKTIRDDDSDKAWEEFRLQLNKFHQRLDAVPKKGSSDYIKCEKEYLECLFTIMLHAGDMAAWILDHQGGENEKT